MKITFITFHNWESKRQGGFHKFAEAAAKAGHDVVFLSIPRPLYSAFLHTERLNRGVLRDLTKGKIYELSDGSKILNCTWPTLDIPNRIKKIIPKQWVDKAPLSSLIPFKSFSNKFLKNTDCFVYESVAPYFFRKFRDAFPNAKFVYRPSDPLMYEGASEEVIKQETDILLTCEKVFVVNQKGLDLYRSHIPEFDKRVNYELLSNGVDTKIFRKKFKCPDLLKKDRTALYMGTFIPNWDAVIYAAKSLPDVNFIIVCPDRSVDGKEEEAEALGNVFYVNGIFPSEVPAWITNANMAIVPYDEGRYKIRPMGMTAKYYQAMAACKPIVVYEDFPELQNYGIHVTYTKEDFAKQISVHINEGSVKYAFDTDSIDWGVITNRFLKGIDEIFSN